MSCFFLIYKYFDRPILITCMHLRRNVCFHNNCFSPLSISKYKVKNAITWIDYTIYYTLNRFIIIFFIIIFLFIPSQFDHMIIIIIGAIMQWSVIEMLRCLIHFSWTQPNNCFDNKIEIMIHFDESFHIWRYYAGDFPAELHDDIYRLHSP